MPDQLASLFGAEPFDDGILRHVLELLPDAVVLFDAEDRLALWNGRYSEMYSRRTPLVRGMSFVEIMRAAVADGLVPEARGREEEWLATRVARHAQPSNTYEHRLNNGRWVRIQERRSADGWSIGVRNDISELKQREETFRLLFEVNPTPMYVADRVGLNFLSVNAAALALYGLTRDEFLTRSMRDIRPERDRAEFEAMVADGSIYDYSGERTWIHLRADGKEIVVVPQTRSLTLDGRPVLLISVSDITEQQVAAAEARRARAFLNTVVDMIPVGVFVKDVRDGGRYLLYNRHGETLLGRSREEVVGRRDEEVFGPADSARFAEQDAEVMQTRTLRIYSDRTTAREDGLPRILSTKKVPILDGSDSEVRYLLGVSEDVTERQMMASRLDHMAHHDALTGLPNRVVLERCLVERIGRDPDETLFYLDLDGFKGVNDTLGHRVGDGLLQGVSARLRNMIRDQDVAVRLGGDEFTLLLGPAVAAASGGARRFASRLIEALSTPYAVAGHTITITASVGIARAGDAEGDTETWLRNADLALYAAKRAGGGTAVAFSRDMDEEARVRRELASDITRGMEADEFEVHYQPVVTPARGELAGFEALVRWRHPTRGLVAPEDFIPVAEELGLVVRLGAWVLRQACLDAATWPRHLIVAVNLSPLQFRDDGLLATVASALARAGLSPERLELEITESVLLADSERNITTLDSLRRLGTRLVLDDFGIGHSSLSYIQRFTFDRIKVDRSFVRGLPGDRRSVAILRAVVALASSLDIAVTAEGVETEEQRDWVTREGCLQAQGYLFGRPEPMREAASRWHGVLAIPCVA